MTDHLDIICITTDCNYPQCSLHGPDNTWCNCRKYSQ